MNTDIVGSEMFPLPLVLHFQDVLEKINDEEFENFCRHNPDMRIELTKEGELLVMPPTGGKTGKRNFALIVEFGIWAENDGSGVSFDSSTVFRLPNGAKRSPDLAWIKNERWESLTNDEQEKFPPLCPDFVVELRSRTDSLSTLQDKMDEYIENGVKLGWLIDPHEQKVHIYQADAETEVLENPETVKANQLLDGFILNMEKIW